MLGPFLLAFKMVVAIASVAAVTGLFILVHDVLTQCDYFKVDKLTISGTQPLTKEQVVRQAQVGQKVNILAVNLSLVRKRLLAHPWISEAEISREIPSGLNIRIKEHTPLAVVDVGEKFLINHQGTVFKAWDASDAVNLPEINGLSASDLTVYGQPGLSKSRGETGHTAPFKSVMKVLELGEKQGSILPNGSVKRIHVDRQIGITIYAFDRVKTINLGNGNYTEKYNKLANLFSYLKRQQSISDFDRIDLNNIQRVVVNPIKIVSPRKGL